VSVGETTASFRVQTPAASARTRRWGDTQYAAFASPNRCPCTPLTPDLSEWPPTAGRIRFSLAHSAKRKKEETIPATPAFSEYPRHAVSGETART